MEILYLQYYRQRYVMLWWQATTQITLCKHHSLMYKKRSARDATLLAGLLTIQMSLQYLYFEFWPTVSKQPAHIHNSQCKQYSIPFENVQYSTVQYMTSSISTLLPSSLVYFSLLYYTVLSSSLVYSPLFQFTLLFSTLLPISLLYSPFLSLHPHLYSTASLVFILRTVQ